MELNERNFYVPKKKITKKYLESNGFRYSKVHSDSDGEVYIKRFIVWRYGSAGVLEGEIMLDCESGNVRVGCYDYGTRYPYAGWYCRVYGSNAVVETIDEKIVNELNGLGAKECQK